MGTGHLILVWYKGKWQIAQYGQLDGDPKCAGKDIIHFLTNSPNLNRYPIKDLADIHPLLDLTAVNVNNVETLKAALGSHKTYVPSERKCEEFEHEAQRIGEEAETLDWSTEVLQNSTRDEMYLLETKHCIRLAKYQSLIMIQPSLSTECCAMILDIVAYSSTRVPVKMSTADIMEWFINWAYVIDLDKEIFEAYHGTETPDSQDPEGRFDREPFVANRDSTRPYLVRIYGFDQLKSVKIENLKGEMEALTALARGEGPNFG